MSTHHNHRPRHRRHDVSVAVALSRYVFFPHTSHRHSGDASEPLTNNIVDLYHRRSNRSDHSMHGDVYSQWLTGFNQIQLFLLVLNWRTWRTRSAIVHASADCWSALDWLQHRAHDTGIESYPVHTLQIAAPQPNIAWPDLLHLALHNSVDALLHTPSIALRHRPPNSARFSYAVSALRKVWVYTDKTVEAT